MMAISESTQAFENPAVASLFKVASAAIDARFLLAYAELDKCLRLRPGWDGYVGVPPSVEATNQAKAFIATLPDEIATPAVEPSGDGEINLVWRTNEAYLEIGFTGAPTFSFFGKTLSTPQRREFGDVPIAANRLPMSLHGLMGLFADADVRLRERAAERAPFAWAS